MIGVALLAPGFDNRLACRLSVSEGLEDKALVAFLNNLDADRFFRHPERTTTGAVRFLLSRKLDGKALREAYSTIRRLEGPARPHRDVSS
jgi:hypothetical protein